MSVKRRPNGKWRARYRDEAGREHARHFDTQREARAWEAHQRSLVARGEHIASPLADLTLAEYLEVHYLPTRSWVQGTINSTRVALKACPFADTPLRRIRRADGERWLAEMTRGLSTSTATMRFSRIRAVLTSAVENEVIRTNPLQGIRTPGQRAGAIERADIPTAGQVALMLEAMCDDPVAQTQIAVLAFAGLRLGELLGLRPEDVLVESQELRVDRQAQKLGGAPLEVRAPKYGSRRVVPIPSQLVGMLTRHVALLGLSPGDWLFPGQTPGEPSSDTRVHTRVVRAAAYARNTAIHPHSLRHFYASSLIEAGLPVTTIARMMGHRNTSTTLDRYGHLMEDSMARARVAAQGLMDGLGPVDNWGRAD